MKKLTKRDIVKIVERDGFIPIDKGNYILFSCKFNKINFPDMPDSLVKQLENEGKTNYYISGIHDVSDKFYSYNSLPVFGMSDKWETKWASPTIEGSLTNSSDYINNPRMLARVNKYVARTMGDLTENDFSKSTLKGNVTYSFKMIPILKIFEYKNRYNDKSTFCVMDGKYVELRCDTLVKAIRKIDEIVKS